MGLGSSSNSYLGIDIGSASLKVVELKKVNGKAKLINYGFSENLKKLQFDQVDNLNFAAKVINKLIADSGITSNSSVSALPTFSVFSSVLNLSNVSEKELKSAVHWEAKKVIPLPLDEMILDYKKIEIDKEQDKKNKKSSKNIQVLLTGAPRTLVKKYIEIFKQSKINLLSLETETFSLVRSLLGNDRSTNMIVEIGANTTDITIVDKSIPILNRSIDMGGSKITEAIAKYLEIDRNNAEQFKYDLGISSLGSDDDDIPDLIVELIAPIVNEIKYASNLYLEKNKKQTEKIILSGGSALLPNLTKYLSKVLNMNVYIGNPWARVSYPSDLEPLLKEIGPRMSVAIGLAMREIE